MTIFEKIDSAKSYSVIKRLLRAEFPLTTFRWGSSRIAIPYCDHLILKVAYNKKGVAQNSTEIDVSRFSTEPYNEYLAQIVDYSRDSKWVLQERVTILDCDIPKEVITFLRECFDISLGDLEQTGKIGNRSVIYDYGLTSSIFNEYYSW